MKAIGLAAAVAIALVTASTSAQNNQPTVAIPSDWRSAARDDVMAFHTVIAANHPGPVDALDPGFVKRSDEALGRALKRADTVRDYPGYLATLRGYAAHFDDGHLTFSTALAVPVALKWPGFLTGYDRRGRQVVRTRIDTAPVPLGAELVACDGRPADRLATELVGQFRGRWWLPAIRGREGFRLFVDNGNPFVERPARCIFRLSGGLRTVTLNWQAFSDTLWEEHAVPLAFTPSGPIAARTLRDGTRWYAINSFDANPSGTVANALTPILADMKRDREAIAAAPQIVLDLRGNGGGSSDWSRRIAAILWGEAAIAQADIDSEAVDWRASAANVATLAQYRDQFGADPDTDPAIKRYLINASQGIAAAYKAGRPLWREPKDLYVPAATAEGGEVASPRARIYVLTDWACASACLDAVDLWKALGAVQVGQETSADTLYMDLRQDSLPGGRVRANIPMKVYRGRRRGSNVPHQPVHRYVGDMRDTVGLETWIAGLTKVRG